MQRSTAGIVADFYEKLSAGDAEAVGAAIDGHFADDAAIEWPQSLPHGGRDSRIAGDLHRDHRAESGRVVQRSSRFMRLAAQAHSEVRHAVAEAIGL